MQDAELAAIFKDLHNRYSWREIKQITGVPVSHATISAIARGKANLSLRRINQLRKIMGLRPRIHPEAQLVINVLACRTCGHVHAVDDCHGVDGEPVILPPGARIVKPSKPRRKRKRYWRPAIPPELRDELEPIIKEFIATRTAAAPPKTREE